MTKKSILWIFIVCMVPLLASGQDLDELLEAETQTGKSYESAAFKATRVINGHSVEQMKARHLDFRISHRFGELNGGSYEFFGLDQATIHLSLEYGIKDWLMAGIGRSSLMKTYDGFVKLKLLRQTAGSDNVPVFLSYMGSGEIFGTKWSDPARDNKFSSRLSYVHQILIARKFSKDLSFQLAPTVVHKNLTATELDSNDLFALGASARYKIGNRVSVNAEYFYAFRSDRASADYPNALSFGVDIETGGHVFQLMLTNSQAMREGGFIWGENNGDWSNSGVHFGFNISRVFSFDKK